MVGLYRTLAIHATPWVGEPRYLSDISESAKHALSRSGSPTHAPMRARTHTDTFITRTNSGTFARTPIRDQSLIVAIAHPSLDTGDAKGSSRVSGDQCRGEHTRCSTKKYICIDVYVCAWFKSDVELLIEV